jgi:hypothetical protein
MLHEPGVRILAPDRAPQPRQMFAVGAAVPAAPLRWLALFLAYVIAADECV